MASSSLWGLWISQEAEWYIWWADRLVCKISSTSLPIYVKVLTKLSSDLDNFVYKSNLALANFVSELYSQ